MADYWLLKTEPGTYSYDDLIRDGSTFWDGVRNFQARNNLKAIKKGDKAFIYHSVGPKEIVGMASVSKEYYPDPTDKTGAWVVVDIKPQKKFKTPVHLETIKTDKILQETALVKQSRLSVMPITPKQADRILELSK